jgi:hypothetical protein
MERRGHVLDSEASSFMVGDVLMARCLEHAERSPSRRDPMVSAPIISYPQVISQVPESERLARELVPLLNNPQALDLGFGRVGIRKANSYVPPGG